MSNTDTEKFEFELELSVSETEQLLEFIQNKTGMIFAPRLHNLVKKEFDKVKEASSIKDKVSFLRGLTSDLRPKEAQMLFESLTVHETMFFRDANYFNFMKNFMFPKLIEMNKNRQALNIWVAAGSSGQEALSILILLMQEFPELNTWTLNIFSTDISSQIIEKAKNGVYEIHELNRGLSEKQLKQYFEQIDNRHWKVKSIYLDKISFKVSNLTEDFTYTLPLMDFISCRNVLIYFNNETKQDIINRLSQKVNLYGFLLLGQVDYINSKSPSKNFEQKIENKFPYYQRTS